MDFDCISPVGFLFLVLSDAHDTSSNIFSFFCVRVAYDAAWIAALLTEHWEEYLLLRHFLRL